MIRRWIRLRAGCLNADPIFDSLRDDRRFNSLLKAVGLPLPSTSKSVAVLHGANQRLNVLDKKRAIAQFERVGPAETLTATDSIMARPSSASCRRRFNGGSKRST